MKTKSVKKRMPRRAAKKVKRPPAPVGPRDGARQGEALTISEAREAAAALAERLKRRFSAFIDPAEEGGQAVKARAGSVFASGST